MYINIRMVEIDKKKRALRYIAKAIELVYEHLGHRWKFKINKKKRAFGTCQPMLREIQISKYLLLAADSWKEVRQTVLHEIAHALTPKHNHDQVWKDKCVELGCRPSRQANQIISHKVHEIIQYKYQYKCPKCKRSHDTHRKKKRISACKSCCIKYNNGEFSEKYVYDLYRRW